MRRYPAVSVSAPPRPLARALPPDSGSPGRRFPVAVLAVAAALMLAFGFGPNQNLAILALAVLVGGCVVLWRPGESPVLVVTFCLSWLGASVAVFHANWLDIDLFRYAQSGGDMEEATILSLVGLLCLALGMRIGAGPWRPGESKSARQIALAHPVSRWFGLYVAACAVSFAALALLWVLPGLSQVLLAVAALRWTFFFAVAYASLVRGGVAGPYLPLAFCGELAAGLGTYFSDFRTVFIFAIYAAFASGPRLTPRLQVGIAALIGALLCLGVVWTGIKEEYRYFVAEGTKQQIVAVDYATRLNKMVELAESLDARTIDTSIDRTLHRMSYVEFFSVVLGYVPNQMPHENGALLADAVARPFLPRAFFPEKSAINDTERTNLYTGGLAGESEGTSISIGYIGETYIDFGAYGMMAALLGIGCVYGLAYRLLSRSKVAGSLVGMGLGSAVLIPVGGLDSSFTKVAGALVVSLLVVCLFLRFLVPFCLTWIARPGGSR